MFIVTIFSRIKKKHNNLAINQFLLTILRFFYIEKVFEIRIEEVFEIKIEKSFEGGIFKIATSITLKVDIKISSMTLKVNVEMSSAT